jgi:hypothetical protein
MNRHELLIYLSVLGFGSVALAAACSSLSPYPGEDPTGGYQAGYQVGTTGGGPTPVDAGEPGDGEIFTDGDLGDGAVPVCPGCKLIATAEDPQSITLDTSNVYWTQGMNTSGGLPIAGTGSIMQAPRAGGAATATVPGLTGPLIAKQANSWLAWSAFSGTSGGQSSVSLVAIPPTTPTTPGSAQNSAYGVALDSTNVYWVSTDATSDVLVQASPLTGGGATTLGTTTGGVYEPFGMAVSSSSIYFVAYLMGGGGGLFQLPIGGGTPSEVWTGGSMSKPLDVAIDPSMTNVYWTDFTMNGAVYSMPVGGGAVSTVASAIAFPAEIAVDSTNVYFTASMGVYEVPIGSTTANVLVSTPGPVGIAADDTDMNVFFSNGVQVLSHGK